MFKFKFHCWLFPYGGGVSGPWGPGGEVPNSLNQLSQTAEPKDYIYSVACEV